MQWRLEVIRNALTVFGIVEGDREVVRNLVMVKKIYWIFVLYLLEVGTTGPPTPLKPRSPSQTSSEQYNEKYDKVVLLLHFFGNVVSFQKMASRGFQRKEPGHDYNEL